MDVCPAFAGRSHLCVVLLSCSMRLSFWLSVPRDGMRVVLFAWERAHLCLSRRTKVSLPNAFVQIGRRFCGIRWHRFCAGVFAHRYQSETGREIVMVCSLASAPVDEVGFHFQVWFAQARHSHTEKLSTFNCTSIISIGYALSPSDSRWNRCLLHRGFVRHGHSCLRSLIDWFDHSVMNTMPTIIDPLIWWFSHEQNVCDHYQSIDLIVQKWTECLRSFIHWFDCSVMNRMPVGKYPSELRYLMVFHIDAYWEMLTERMGCLQSFTKMMPTIISWGITQKQIGIRSWRLNFP